MCRRLFNYGETWAFASLFVYETTLRTNFAISDPPFL